MLRVPWPRAFPFMLSISLLHRLSTLWLDALAILIAPSVRVSTEPNCCPLWWGSRNSAQFLLTPTSHPSLMSAQKSPQKNSGGAFPHIRETRLLFIMAYYLLVKFKKPADMGNTICHYNLSILYFTFSKVSWPLPHAPDLSPKPVQFPFSSTHTKGSWRCTAAPLSGPILGDIVSQSTPVPWFRNPPKSNKLFRRLSLVSWICTFELLICEALLMRAPQKVTHQPGGSQQYGSVALEGATVP